MDFVSETHAWALHAPILFGDLHATSMPVGSTNFITLPAPLASGVHCPFNHLYLQFVRLANLYILQVYFDVWRAILLLLRNSAYTGVGSISRVGPEGAFSSEIKKVTKINQKHTTR